MAQNTTEAAAPAASAAPAAPTSEPAAPPSAPATHSTSSSGHAPPAVDNDAENEDSISPDGSVTPDDNEDERLEKAK
jgi:hypothetical protein